LSSASSPTFKAGAAQAAGYSTGQARGGGYHHTQISGALKKAIGESQANNPIAWKKATGTDDAGKQLSMVLNLSESRGNISFTVTHKEKVSARVKELRDYASTFNSGHPSVSRLLKEANELEKIQTYSEEVQKDILEKQHLDFDAETETITVPKDPPPEIETPVGVTLTGISEGATVTFLNPTTAAVATQPLMVKMPSGAGDYVQETYNIAVEKYGKETADKLATQTYLTREELKIQYPLHAQKDPPKPTPKTQQPVISLTPKDEPTSTTLTKSVIFPPTPTTPATPVSTISILPIIIIAVALIGILLFLRRRA